MNSKHVVLALSLLSFSAFAAPASKSKARLPTSTTSSTLDMPKTTSGQALSPKGIRLSLFKPAIKMTTKMAGSKSDRTLDNTFGISVGYANLPYKQLGWTANGSYIEIFEAGEKYGLVRADANVGYGFEKNLNIKGGLNMAKFLIPARIRDEYNPNIGVQASAGLQMTNNLGLDVGYTYMKHTNSNEEILLSGLEVGLHGTF